MSPANIYERATLPKQSVLIGIFKPARQLMTQSGSRADLGQVADAMEIPAIQRIALFQFNIRLANDAAVCVILLAKISSEICPAHGIWI
jgi:hypothetical protein